MIRDQLTRTFACLLVAFSVVLAGCGKKADTAKSPQPDATGSDAAAPTQPTLSEKSDTAKSPQPDATGSDAAAPTQPTLSEREVAERILLIGGQVEILIAGKRQTVKAGESLPAESFLVVSCILPEKESKSRDVLMLKDLTRLTELNLAFSGLRDEDLSLLEHLPTLEYLKIGFLSPLTELTDEGLRTIADCENLQKFGLGNAPNITGDGLSHLAGNQSVREVIIYSNPHLTGNDIQQLTKSDGLVKVSLLHQPEQPLPASKIDGLSGIPELYFHDCKLDDASIDSLCNLSGLKKAYFSYCTITPGQEERLRTKLKGVDLWIDQRRPSNDSSSETTGNTQETAKLPALTELERELIDMVNKHSDEKTRYMKKSVELLNSLAGFEKPEEFLTSTEIIRRVAKGNEDLEEVEKILRQAENYKKKGQLGEIPSGGTKPWGQIFASNAVTYTARYMVSKFKLELDGSPLNSEALQRYDDALAGVVSLLKSTLD